MELEVFACAMHEEQARSHSLAMFGSDVHRSVGMCQSMAPAKRLVFGFPFGLPKKTKVRRACLCKAER